MKKLFTTGDVAKLLGININTVIKWFDEGQLQGFRLPSGQDRRIPFSNLRAFMARKGFPLDLLEDGGQQYRRAHPRARCSGDVSFTVIAPTGGRAIRGRLSDVSRGGARVVYFGNEALGLSLGARRVHLRVHDGPLAGMDLPAQLVHVRVEDDSLILGLRFSRLGERQLERLDNLILTQVAPKGRITA